MSGPSKGANQQATLKFFQANLSSLPKERQELDLHVNVRKVVFLAFLEPTQLVLEVLSFPHQRSGQVK
jgi:hypothetical protein